LGTNDPMTAIRMHSGPPSKIFFTVVVPARRWTDR
jgi:hypothetical protein